MQKGFRWDEKWWCDESRFLSERIRTEGSVSVAGHQELNTNICVSAGLGSHRTIQHFDSTLANTWRLPGFMGVGTVQYLQSKVFNHKASPQGMMRNWIYQYICFLWLEKIASQSSGSTPLDLTLNISLKMLFAILLPLDNPKLLFGYVPHWNVFFFECINLYKLIVFVLCSQWIPHLVEPQTKHLFLVIL